MNDKALAVQQKVGGLKQYLNSDTVKKSLEETMPQWLSIDRLLRVFMGAVNKNPALLDCTRESILISCMQCAQLGLEPILGRAWLVPYNNSKQINGQWVKVSECQMQPGYQGLIDLARRSNTISDVYGLNVYENDDFDISFGTDRRIHHKPWYLSKAHEPGEIIGAYVVWVLKDGTQHPEFMHISDIHKRRDISKAYQSAIKYKKDTPWLQWPDEMNLKTVVKHSSKMVPASIEFMQAVEVDNASEAGRGPYLPEGSDMFLPQVEPDEPPEGDDLSNPWEELKKELISKGITAEQIDEFVTGIAEENNMSTADVEASAVEERESFINSVLKIYSNTRGDDEKLRKAEELRKQKAEADQASREKEQSAGLEKIDKLAWLTSARPSSSLANAEEWLKVYAENEEEINFHENRKLRDQLKKKKEKTEAYIKTKRAPKEPPPAPGAHE